MGEKKLIHIRIVDGSQEDFRAMGLIANKLKETFPDYEFLYTDENIQLTSVKYLMNELYELYKLEKKLHDKKEVKDGTVEVQ
jgi:hypothetical protein